MNGHLLFFRVSSFLSVIKRSGIPKRSLLLSKLLHQLLSCQKFSSTLPGLVAYCVCISRSALADSCSRSLHRFVATLSLLHTLDKKKLKKCCVLLKAPIIHSQSVPIRHLSQSVKYREQYTPNIDTSAKFCPPPSRSFVDGTSSNEPELLENVS